MLNEYQERETMGGQKKDLFPYPLKLLHRYISKDILLLYLSHAIILFSSVHEIASIEFFPSPHRLAPKENMSSSVRDVRRGEGVEGRFVSIAKDGTLSVWNNNLTLNKVTSVRILIPVVIMVK